MIQVSIANSKTGQSYGGSFETSTLAQAWITQCEASNVWGKPQRTIVPNSQGELIDIDGTVLQASNALSSSLVTLVPAAAAVSASYSGTPEGYTSSVTITAQTAGSAGNITLVLDGTSTLSALLSEWNSTYTANQLILTSGIGTQVPLAGTLSLTGGTNAIDAVTQMQYIFPADYTITQTDITSNQTLNPDWISLIAQRDQLLQLCDWIMLSDSPYAADQAAWVTYREALRNLPNNNVNTNPTTITFPTPPTTPLIKGINS